VLPNVLAFDLNPIVPFLSPIVSVIAACAAALVARFAWLQKHAEMRRTLRNQMSDAVSRTYTAERELADIEAELANDQATEKKRAHLRSKRTIIKDQCYLTTHQAAYVLQESLEREKRKKLHSMSTTEQNERKELIEKLLKEFRFSHVEYAAIARGFEMGGDPQAPDYWQLALDASDGLAQALYRREYSKFLFSANNLKEGREQFQETINSLNTLKKSVVSNTDNYLWELMWTYFEWAKQENKKAPEENKASTYLDKAEETIGQLRNVEKKNNAREILNEQRASISPDKPLRRESQASSSVPRSARS
jgi:hypothetical protein